MKNTIQYYHDRENNRTFAVDVNLTAGELWHLILANFNHSFTFNVGVSHVHPNDHYCKQTGREVSVTKLEPVKYRLNWIDNYGEELMLHFQNESDMIGSIRFKLKAGNMKPHMIYCS